MSLQRFTTHATGANEWIPSFSTWCTTVDRCARRTAKAYSSTRVAFADGQPVSAPA